MLYTYDDNCDVYLYYKCPLQCCCLVLLSGVVVWCCCLVLLSGVVVWYFVEVPGLFVLQCVCVCLWGVFLLFVFLITRKRKVATSSHLDLTFWHSKCVRKSSSFRSRQIFRLFKCLFKCEYLLPRKRGSCVLLLTIFV